MAMLWFVLALIFLAAALVVFRLDKRQKGGDGPARGAGTPPALGDGTDGGVAAGGARPAPFAEPAPVDDGRQGLDRQGLDSGAGPDEVTRPAPGSEPAPGPSPWSAPVAPGAPAAGPQDAYPAGGAPYVGDRPHDSATDFHGSTEPDAGHDSDSDGRAGEDEAPKVVRRRRSPQQSKQSSGSDDGDGDGEAASEVKPRRGSSSRPRPARRAK